MARKIDHLLIYISIVMFHGYNVQLFSQSDTSPVQGKSPVGHCSHPRRVKTSSLGFWNFSLIVSAEARRPARMDWPRIVWLSLEELEYVPVGRLLQPVKAYNPLNIHSQPILHNRYMKVIVYTMIIKKIVWWLRYHYQATSNGSGVPLKMLASV